jgi:hypothetical protein
MREELRVVTLRILKPSFQKAKQVGFAYALELSKVSQLS